MKARAHHSSKNRQVTIHPSILMGTPTNYDFSLLGSLGRLKLSGGQWVVNNQPLSKDHGLIWLTQYQSYPLLVIYTIWRRRP